MSDHTITSLDSYTLSSTLTSGTNIEFIGVGGTLTIEPAAITATGIGGTIGNFSPGDFLTIANAEAVITELGYPTDAGYAAALSGSDLFVAPNGAVTSNSFLYSFLPTATKLQIQTISNEIEHDLFGPAGLTAPLTLAVVADVDGTTHDLVATSTADINPCFAAGTQIRTAGGAQVKVEDLVIGDVAETFHGALQKIKWIGQRSYDGRFIAGNKDILPICIKRHAIAENIPARDLFVSPGHAICIDGALIHAFRLVNGVSITQAAAVESLTYYHIETENHEVIFAENCPAETFIDEAFRAQFQNAAQFHEQYPGQRAAAAPCLPQLQDGFSLHAIQQRLNARAGLPPEPETQGPLRGYVDEPGPAICSGWAQDMENPEAPVCLDILVDGARVARVLANFYRPDLRQAGLGSGCHAFRATLPAGATGRLEVRRAADSAELSWTDAALAQAA
jgi:hypothetical protein